MLEKYFKNWIKYHQFSQQQNAVIEANNNIKSEKFYQRQLKKRVMKRWKNLYGIFQTRYQKVYYIILYNSYVEFTIILLVNYI